MAEDPSNSEALAKVLHSHDSRTDDLLLDVTSSFSSSEEDYSYPVSPEFPDGPFQYQLHPVQAVPKPYGGNHAFANPRLSKKAESQPPYAGPHVAGAPLWRGGLILSPGGCLGRGSFYEVDRARTATGDVVAVRSPLSSCSPNLVLAEVSVFAKLNTPGHPNVLNLLGVIPDYRLVFPAFDTTLGAYVNELARTMEKGTCDALIDLAKPVCTRPVWLDWARQLASGLLYIHSKDIVHGDIKPENILMDVQMNRLVIADFSSAGCPPPCAAAITPAFSAPEIRAGSACTKESDIYSLGVTMAFCATGAEPYAEAKNPTQKLMWQARMSPISSYPAESQQRINSVRPTVEMLLARVALPKVLSAIAKEQIGEEHSE